jgi:hypothetical protein
VSARGIALLGGPASGKTTYLGALVDALQTDQIPHLRLGDLPADALAYDRLAEPLLGAIYPQRTKEERHVLDLPLRAARKGGYEDVSLTMGDYDGEEVERLFDNRTHGFSPEWQARASASGLLLFLRPDALKPLPRLRLPPASHAAPKSAPLGPEAAFGPGLQDEIPDPGVAGQDDPVLVPTELAIIELLQFLRHARGLGPGDRPRHGAMRIALLVSAWDSVERERRDKGPAHFFVERASLLEDYLWSNYHLDDVFHFGLSSTGGDLRDARYHEHYQSDPHGFVEWCDATGRVQSTRNLALPIEWALFGEPALMPAEARAHS